VYAIEALQEAAERQRAVAAALTSVRAKGLEPGAEDLTLFAELAAGRLSTDELRERVPSATQVSDAAGDPYLDSASGVLRNLLGITDAAELARAEALLSASRLIDLERRRLPGRTASRPPAKRTGRELCTGDFTRSRSSDAG
jgi:hypothetical protein